jgi:hypothetical protein
MLAAIEGTISFEFLEQRTAAATQKSLPCSVYEPESQISLLKAEAAIDRQIKNAIQQLTVMKEYDQLYCTREPESMKAIEPRTQVPEIELAHDILERIDDRSEQAKPAGEPETDTPAGDLESQTDPATEKNVSEPDLPSEKSSECEDERGGAVTEPTLQPEVEAPSSDSEAPTQPDPESAPPPVRTWLSREEYFPSRRR